MSEAQYLINLCPSGSRICKTVWLFILGEIQQINWCAFLADSSLSFSFLPLKLFLFCSKGSIHIYILTGLMIPVKKLNEKIIRMCHYSGSAKCTNNFIQGTTTQWQIKLISALKQNSHQEGKKRDRFTTGTPWNSGCHWTRSLLLKISTIAFTALVKPPLCLPVPEINRVFNTEKFPSPPAEVNLFFLRAN